LPKAQEREAKGLWARNQGIPITPPRNTKGHTVANTADWLRDDACFKKAGFFLRCKMSLMTQPV
jgi:hypothetical protein